MARFVADTLAGVPAMGASGGGGSPTGAAGEQSQRSAASGNGWRLLHQNWEISAWHLLQKIFCPVFVNSGCIPLTWWSLSFLAAATTRGSCGAQHSSGRDAQGVSAEVVGQPGPERDAAGAGADRQAESHDPAGCSCSCSSG